MIRSAKMNATTPPKLMPPFHSTAASGTLPIEQTKLTTATSGPTSGPQSRPRAGGRSGRTCCQNDSGTHAATAPAISRPMTRSRRIAAHSMTKTCATDGEARRRRAAAARTSPRPATRHVHRGVALHRAGEALVGLLAGRVAAAARAGTAGTAPPAPRS